MNSYSNEGDFYDFNRTEFQVVGGAIGRSVDKNGLQLSVFRSSGHFFLSVSSSPSVLNNDANNSNNFCESWSGIDFGNVAGSFMIGERLALVYPIIAIGVGYQGYQTTRTSSNGFSEFSSGTTNNYRLAWRLKAGAIAQIQQFAPYLGANYFPYSLHLSSNWNLEAGIGWAFKS